MTFSSLDDEEDGKYNGVGLLQISEIFVTQDYLRTAISWALYRCPGLGVIEGWTQPHHN